MAIYSSLRCIGPTEFKRWVHVPFLTLPGLSAFSEVPVWSDPLVSWETSCTVAAPLDRSAVKRIEGNISLPVRSYRQRSPDKEPLRQFRQKPFTCSHLESTYEHDIPCPRLGVAEGLPVLVTANNFRLSRTSPKSSRRHMVSMISLVPSGTWSFHLSGSSQVTSTAQCYSLTEFGQGEGQKEHIDYQVIILHLHKSSYQT
ncbi:hypothetical protein EDB82DRAFT_230159 [Fusarium venenatum]|uniref:uncharacterized protein n=1 Tax=Fusarium venenatum TaxID=56646 RepID=UPI001DB294C7|nr:hypothetical protein EDB82DRAFT_230159 [Fusarium venenatum]